MNTITAKTTTLLFTSNYLVIITVSSYQNHNLLSYRYGILLSQLQLTLLSLRYPPPITIVVCHLLLASAGENCRLLQHSVELAAPTAESEAGVLGGLLRNGVSFGTETPEACSLEQTLMRVIGPSIPIFDLWL